MPPGKLATSPNPALSRIAVACAERLPARQIEVLHVADIVALADLAAEPGIELLLLGDAGRGQAAIVVRRIEQAGLGQAEVAAARRAVEGARVTLLEDGA